jgi:hypothetical protein
MIKLRWIILFICLTGTLHAEEEGMLIDGEMFYDGVPRRAFTEEEWNRHLGDIEAYAEWAANQFISNLIENGVLINASSLRLLLAPVYEMLLAYFPDGLPIGLKEMVERIRDYVW